MTVQMGEPPQRLDCRLFLFGQNSSLDHLAGLVQMAHREFAGDGREDQPPFPGPTVNAWLKYVFGQVANDKYVPHSTRLQMWWAWANGYQVSGNATNEVAARITAEARQRGLSEEPDAFLLYWTVGDLLAASAVVLDRWLTVAGIPCPPASESPPEAEPGSPDSSSPDVGTEQKKTPRIEAILPLPDGRNLVLPVREMSGTAAVGAGLKGEFCGEVGIDKLPDILAFAAHLSQSRTGQPAAKVAPTVTGASASFEAALRKAAGQRQEQQMVVLEQATLERQAAVRQTVLHDAWEAVHFLDASRPKPGEDLKSVSGWCAAYAARLQRLGRKLQEYDEIESIRNWAVPAEAEPGLILAHELVCLGADPTVTEGTFAERIGRILREAPNLFAEMQQLWFRVVRQKELPWTEGSGATAADPPLPPCTSEGVPDTTDYRESKKPSPCDGTLDHKGRVSLDGVYHRFGFQQKRLLLWILGKENGKVDDAIHDLGLTGDDHFNKLLHDLRTSIAKKLKKADRTFTILLEGQTLSYGWTERRTM
jgi:hypothetical protein